jgi:hypothetical protein
MSKGGWIATCCAVGLLTYLLGVQVGRSVAIADPAAAIDAGEQKLALERAQMESRVCEARFATRTVLYEKPEVDVRGLLEISPGRMLPVPGVPRWIIPAQIKPEVLLGGGSTPDPAMVFAWITPQGQLEGPYRPVASASFSVQGDTDTPTGAQIVAPELGQR